MNVNIPRKTRRNTELADAAPAALDTRRARTVRAPLFSHSKVRRKSAIALMRSVFLQPAGLGAPATAMPACRGWCLQEPPRHQRRAARLRSSWHGLRGCCWPRCGRCGHRAGPRLVALWAHSVGAACCTLTASELCVVFVRRIWQLIAGLHRYRATARLWCNGDRSVVR